MSGFIKYDIDDVRQTYKATVDIGEVVREITKRIVAVEEGAVEGILERAFIAGYRINVGYAYDRDTHFEPWLTALKEEVLCRPGTE